MPTLTTPQDLTLYYEQRGRGPDLLLIGGLSADCSVWSFVVDALAENFRVTTFDNRGVGQSDAPAGPYTLQMMADDTLALLDALQIPRTRVVGHSMGGAILQLLCLEHPDRVARAVICASAARVPLPSQQHVESVAQLREAGIAPELLALVTMPWIFGEAFLQDDARVVLARAALLGNPRPQSIAAFRAQVAACIGTDLRRRLAAIHTPTLILAGREDILTPVRCSEELHRGIREAQLTILDDCAHMVQVEQPERFVALVTDFLRNA
ncbi:MAG: alpha/beta fold hydrolase [Deltaproteobacteria bacterium]|nr:alpha/beta fold hydrolase [Deltaproteobacteria bacterium]